MKKAAKMRIMHISTKKDHSCFYGAVLEQAATEDVTFLVLRTQDNPGYRVFTTYIERGIRYIHLGVATDFDLSPDERLERCLKVLFKKYAPDVLHIQLFSGVNALSILRSCFGLPVKKIVSLHDHSLFCARGVYFDEGKVCFINSMRDCGCLTCRAAAARSGMMLLSYNRLRQARCREVVSLADHIICASFWQKTTVIKLLGAKEKTTVLYYGLSMPPAVKTPAGVAARATFGYLGSLSYLKGVDLLEQAMKKLGDAKAGMIMCLLYDRVDADSAAYVRRFRRYPAVRILKNVKEKDLYDKFFSKIDYLIVPSLWEETGPMTLFEAFFYGIPVIVADRPSLLEKIKGMSGSVSFSGPEDLLRIIKGAAEKKARTPRRTYAVKSAKKYAFELSRIYRGQRGNGRKLLTVKTGYLCNNNCLFCVTGDNQPRGFVDPDTIKDRLIKYRPQYRDLLITGGEPTLHPGFSGIYGQARSIGYRITLETNARIFSNKGACADIAGSGLTIVTHVESWRPAVHEAITRAPGSFHQVMSALRNIRGQCSALHVKIMVVKLNYRDLLLTARLISKFKADRVWFVFLDPAGHAERYFDAIVPEYRKVRPFLEQALSWLAQNTTIEARLENFPYCCLDIGLRSQVWYQLDQPAENMFGIFPDKKNESTYHPLVERIRRKRKFAQCRVCRYDALCEGVYKRYVDTYGSSEFVPVRA